LEPTSTQLLRDTFEHFDIVLDVGSPVFRRDGNAAQGLAFNDILGVFVRKFGRRLDDSLPKPFLEDSSVAGYGEDSRKGQAILTRNKTAQLLAQSRRKHRDSTLNEVHARGTFTSIAVQGGVGLDEVRNVRNVNPDIVCAVLVQLDGKSVVKILGCLGIDAEDTVRAKILANLELPLWDAKKG
jgi:hypothetical protein